MYNTSLMPVYSIASKMREILKYCASGPNYKWVFPFVKLGMNELHLNGGLVTFSVVIDDLIGLQ